MVLINYSLQAGDLSREATVYTEMNAISKGVSLGIYDTGKGKGVEAARGGLQPYVDLMGRRSVFHNLFLR